MSIAMNRSRPISGGKAVPAAVRAVRTVTPS